MTNLLVQLNQVSKHYGDFAALNKVTMQLAQGEVLGLLGHNGAGKTTLMKLILGLISPTAGELKVLGYAPDSTQAWHSRQLIGYLPENVSFYEQLSGLKVLTYFAKLKGYKKNQAIELLEQVGLSHAMHRAVKTYSKGMRQRLGLAQAFLGKPKLLLLDEPTTGLDPTATLEFYQTVEQLKAQGTSIIICSHVLPGVERHIDKALIMGQGKPLAYGTLAELRQLANLPTIIKPQGINGDAGEHPILKQFWQHPSLVVPEQQKLMVLRELLQLDALDNLTMESASLERLYQFFLHQHAISDTSTGAQS